jgi:hypothetical protein
MQTDETKRQVPGGFDSELRGATWTWSRYPGTAKPRRLFGQGEEGNRPSWKTLRLECRKREEG